MNPLLDFSDLPRFDAVKPDHIGPAVAQLIADARTTVERVATDSTPPTWDSFVLPLEEATERLGRAWGIVGHLHAVDDNQPLRDAYNENLPKVTEFWTDLGQDLRLFARYKALRDGPAYASLNAARRKIVANELRDFRLSGAELPDDKKARFKEIAEAQSALSAKFSENLLDATNAFTLHVEPARLGGVPQDVVDAMQEAARADNKPGCKITLQAPSYLPVMQYANDRALREQLYREYATRASETGSAQWNNAPLIDDILKLRREEAQLLGYQNFGEVSLVSKMASTPKEVTDFLRDMAKKAKPFAQRDVEELRAFAKTELSLSPLEPWDLAFASEKLREQRYAFSDQEVKEYFQEPRVLAGLFKVIETLFGVAVKPDTATTWHPDVKFFRIERGGALIGQFYLDLYARDTKRGGAWMDDARGRALKSGHTQTPVAYLTCNFARPAAGKPALFTHDDVITLFHEFGHGLHHMLTRVDDLGVSGISGVEWDAVELPSQFMENFCWEWDVLQGMTAHVETGKALPRTLYDKMIAAKNFQSGMQTVRQIEFSLFDMHLHTDFDAAKASPLQLLEQIRDEVAVVKPPAYQRFPNSFSHIFSGGYAAGYYSYKWAEVLSADAYAYFEELAAETQAGTLNAQAGTKFLNEILSVGGSRPALESFKAFRGRNPTPDALLRHSGMIS